MTDVEDTAVELISFFRRENVDADTAIMAMAIVVGYALGRIALDRAELNSNLRQVASKIGACAEDEFGDHRVLH